MTPLRVVLLILALASLAAAAALEVNGQPATNAWGAFVGLIGVIVGHPINPQA